MITKPPLKVVLASNNPKKLQELNAILAPLAWRFVAQAQLGVTECAEPHLSFVENALEKARHASRSTGLPALADDSGLCVDALGGAPGVHSARYAGEPKSDARNNAKLLKAFVELEQGQGAENVKRGAHFVAVLVFVRHADDPQPIIAEGQWRGEILKEERGTAGFGYDPLFFLPALGITSAELPAPEKNRLSHRGQAVQHFLARINAMNTMNAINALVY